MVWRTYLCIGTVSVVFALRRGEGQAVVAGNPVRGVTQKQDTHILARILVTYNDVLQGLYCTTVGPVVM